MVGGMAMFRSKTGAEPSQQTGSAHHSSTKALKDAQANTDDSDLVFPNNRQALQYLEQEQERLEVLGHMATAAAASLWLLFPPAGAVGLMLPLRDILNQLQKAGQIKNNLTLLLEKFEDRGVILTPNLAVPDNGSLDLFVRFPNPPKAVFAIGFRTNGESSIFFNEEKEALFFRRKRGGYKAWQVDLFRRFALQEFWLRKNRQSLFGQSSRDKNRPAVKLLVLTGKTRLGQHSEHLYAMIGEQRVLNVRNKVSLFIMEEHQLTPFIEAWLAKLNSPNNG